MVRRLRAAAFESRSRTALAAPLAPDYGGMAARLFSDPSRLAALLP